MFSIASSYFTSKSLVYFSLIITFVVILPVSVFMKSTKVCISLTATLKAKHKTCFLRPDTGPCRADIIQWYYDAKQRKCYRFWWGGCQGNGNKFETKEECYNYCRLNGTLEPMPIPLFCNHAFDYGTCFGYYERWAYDPLYKTCKRRLYSGCGGNQNNFQTIAECFMTCLIAPNNSYHNSNQKYTTCIPIDLPELYRRKMSRRRRR